MQKVLIALGATAAIFAGAGCSSTEAPESGSSPATSSAPIEGKRYAGLTAVTVDPDQVTFDLQEYLTGPEAQAAAAADGETLDGDVYIVNTDTDTATLPVTDNVKVTILKRGGGSSAPKIISFASFERRFNTESDPESLRTHGYWLQIGEGQVTSIVEQFQP